MGAQFLIPQGGEAKEKIDVKTMLRQSAGLRATWDQFRTGFGGQVGVQVGGKLV